MFLLTENNY